MENISKKLINPEVFKALLKKDQQKKEGVNLVGITKKLSAKKFAK